MKLSPAQRKTLRNLRSGLASWIGLRGQSAFGGHHQTMQSLRRRGFVDKDDRITKSGCQALMREK